MPPTPSGECVQWVSSRIIREEFNLRQYYQLAQSGEVQQVVRKSRHCRRPPTGSPHCTHSQIVVYYLRGQMVALVHQYLHPDGTLGASGLPDPKRLWLGSRTLAVR